MRLFGVRSSDEARRRRKPTAYRPSRSLTRPSFEHLEEMLLLSAAPVVSFGTSSASAPVMVQDLVPGPNSSYPQNLTPAGQKLFFLAFDQSNNFDKLWVTDGTSASIPAPAQSLEANAPIAVGSSVVFDAYDSTTNSFEVWVSDGTNAGTYSIGVLPRSSFDSGATVGNTAYFELYDNQANQYELWKSDGTAQGTGMVAALPDYASNFTAVGNELFFTTDDSTTGTALWSSNGTSAGTGLVATLDTTGTSPPQALTDVNGTLYFIASSSTSAGVNELWRSDGSPGGTTTISTPLPPREIAAYGNTLVFTGMDSSDNAAVYLTGGTAASTTLLESLPAGMPFGLAVANATIFFGEYPDASPNFQLWSSNGTTAGTKQIASIVDSTEFTAAGNRIFFAVDDPVAGNELYASDGTPAGTGLLGDINPGPNSSNPSNLTALGSTLFFSADDGTHGTELWKVNPPAQSFPTTDNEGSVLSGVGSFTDAPGSGPWTATVNYGDGSGVQPLTLNSDGSFQLSHLYEQAGSYSISVSVTDGASQTGTGSITVTVNTVAPTAQILGSPASSPEGTAITLTGSATNPSSVVTAAGFTDSWSVTQDGAPYTTGTGSSFTFTPDDDGVYVVTLTATDSEGVAGLASQTIVVTNVPPTPTIVGAPTSSPEGTTIALTSTVTDPSTVDMAAGFTETWGVTKDGTAFATGTGATFSFTPDDDGTYVVTLAATDQDGGSSSVSQTIIVTNVPPTPTIVGAPATSPAGTAISLTASVSDPSPVDTAAGFQDAWTVTQNGTTVGSGTGSSYQFTPMSAGTYVVTLAASDQDGATGTTSQTITVTASLKLALSGDSVGVPGQPRVLNIAVTTGNGSATTPSAPVVINWGDGSAVQTIAPGNPLTAVHVFNGVGTYNVTVSTTSNGSTSTATWSIQVGNVELETDPFFSTLKDLVIGVSSSSDKIKLSPGSTSGSVQVTIDKTVVGTFTPSGLVIVYTPSNDDNVHVTGGLKLPIFIVNTGTKDSHGDGDDQNCDGDHQNRGGDDQNRGLDSDDILESLAWNRH